MKRLSIIIPVYNEAPFLRRCLDSVNCLHPSVEIIVIDDGSTDGSAEICDEYRDNVNFKIGHHRTNWGVSMTRTHGILLAEGKYITFLDSDDEMSKDGIWNMLEVIREANALPVLEDRPVIQFNHFRHYYRTNKTVTKYKNRIGNYYYDNLPKMWCMVWNKIYLRSFIVEHKIGFEHQLQYGEDEIFNLRCLKYHASIYCADELTTIKHFDNQGSICHNLNKEKLLGQTDALIRLLNEDNSQVFDALVRNVISEHWNSDLFKKIIGGDM